jgi:hypothetical protein
MSLQSGKKIWSKPNSEESSTISKRSSIMPTNGFKIWKKRSAFNSNRNTKMKEEYIYKKYNNSKKMFNNFRIVITLTVRPK